MSVSVRARVPTYALALVIAGGAIWVLAAAASRPNIVLHVLRIGRRRPGVSTSGYPPAAIHSLA